MNDLLYLAVLNFFKVLLRHLSSIVGSMLATKGYLSSDSWQGIIEAAAGVLLIVAPIAWANLERWFAAKLAANHLTPHETNQLIVTATRAEENTPVSIVKARFKEATGVEKTI